MSRPVSNVAPTKIKDQRNRHLGLVLRLFFCIVIVGLALFAYIDKQNELTELRIAVPILAKEVKDIHEENIRLKYEIEQFESPIHLMELMRLPEYAQLKFPYLKDEVFLPKAASLNISEMND
jgi:hypothetical protein